MARTHFKLLVCLFILSGTTIAEAGCFKSVRELKANHVGTRWQETTENDGMPLIISITDGGGSLAYSARKAGKLWLTGNVSVCQTGGKTEITLKNTKATNNVPALAKMGLPSTQTTYIANGQIKLAGGGWGGTFVSQ